ncbi:MAG TPA: hypothetical protein VMH33_07525 [Solirubrobacterales bacterium]|nr:hypothetical protein [Solirubrobacterales bacterium]
MPERNRVTPTGEIVATSLRGEFTGNRGVLHEGREIVRFHAGDLWITCALEFRGRHRELWLPGRWTPLFFHDEAVALAAGHRPCGECRHAEYQAYKATWAEGLGGAPPSAGEMNRRLHAERIFRGTRRRRFHDVPWAELPDGAFVHDDGAPRLVLDGGLVAWSPAGYGERRRRPRRGTATAITPPASLAVLRAAYPVRISVEAHRAAT